MAAAIAPNPLRLISVSHPNLLPLRTMRIVHEHGGRRRQYTGRASPSTIIPGSTIKTQNTMSKGNLFLGLARGSVGDVTFYRRNAQQVTRVRVREIKNPKTTAQQMQRAIMRTAINAYKVIKSICDHSFEGVSYGANSYSEFLKLNLNMLRTTAAEGNGQDQKSFLPKGYNGLTAMPWVLSKGTIDWVGVQTQFNAQGVHVVFNANTTGISSIEEVKYEDFIDFYGLQPGDQLTLIAFPKRNDDGGASCIAPIISRIILVSGNGLPEDAMFNASGKVINQNSRNENADAWTFQFATGRISANISNPSDYIGAAAIISRQNADGSWKRSPAIMELNSAEQLAGYSLWKAAVLLSAQIDTESSWYLNNANEEG